MEHVSLDVVQAYGVGQELRAQGQHVRLVELPTSAVPQQVRLDTIDVLHPNAVHELQVTQIGHELLRVTATAFKYVVPVYQIANKGIVLYVLPTPILACGVTGTQGTLQGRE